MDMVKVATNETGPDTEDRTRTAREHARSGRTMPHARVDDPVRHGDPSVGAAGDPTVAAAIEGDADACTLLVRAHLRKAMAVAIEYMPTREDAEDVVQEAFRSAFASLGRFDPSRPFAPWFFTILRNTARNALASHRLRSHETLSPAHHAPGDSPLESARRVELRRAIEHAIESLPRGQRVCFRLCVVEGLSSAEAAGATGLAESTVRVHIFRARQALRELLQSWSDEVG